MKELDDLMAALSEPFPPEDVSWRIGSTTKDKTRGMALAYLDARDVMDRLDEVVGRNNWQDTMQVYGDTYVCSLALYLPCEPFDQGKYHWVTKTDVSGTSDIEKEKGAASGAFKRAAVKWGIGRYLYELDSPWVEIEQKGRSSVIKPSEKGKLIAALGGKAPAPAPASKPKARPRQEKQEEQTEPSKPYHVQLQMEIQPKAWAAAGFEASEVPDNELDIPVRFALSNMGLGKLTEITTLEQFEQAKEWMRTWVKNQREAGDE